MPKSRTSKNKNNKSKLNLWYMVAIVLVVVIAGYAIVRFSNASGPQAYKSYQQTITAKFSDRNPTHINNQCYTTDASGTWCYFGRSSEIVYYFSQAILYGRAGDSRCATMFKGGDSALSSKFDRGAEKSFNVGDRVTIVEYFYGQKACNIGKPLQIQNPVKLFW